MLRPVRFAKVLWPSGRSTCLPFANQCFVINWGESSRLIWLCPISNVRDGGSHCPCVSLPKNQSTSLVISAVGLGAVPFWKFWNLNSIFRWIAVRYIIVEEWVTSHRKIKKKWKQCLDVGWTLAPIKMSIDIMMFKLRRFIFGRYRGIVEELFGSDFSKNANNFWYKRWLMLQLI